ncbi:glucose-methanol-choline oxidoreductase [Seiridium cupressi]
MAITYDFVVVGSGPAGSAVAAGLANAPKKPSVLLLEAGPDNEDRNLRIDGQRWQTFMKEGVNWGYKTVPQEYAANRECDYSRGKGLGGSSAINFGVYTIGARDDYDEWARIVGDDAFRWEKIQARFKALETFDGKLPQGVSSKYAAPKSSDHGTSGPLKVGYAAEWEDDLPPLLDAFEKAGFALNPDHNSGNPLGMSVLVNSASNGLRSTSKDLLVPQPENLTIQTSSPVQRVILDGDKVVGVESDGRKYYASKEVVLSAGSLDTPKILMHSGLGPADQLRKFNIPVKQNIPALGQGLRDHMFSPLVFTRKAGSTSRSAFYGDEKIMQAALEQWKKDGTGPWAKYACETGIGYFKLDTITSSPEFEALPAEEKRYLQSATVPHMEVITHFPMHWFIPNFQKQDLDYSCLLAFLYNAQSRGEVTLQSSDPDVPLLFDPKFLAHPYDRRAAIESLRAILKVANSEAYSKDSIAQLVGPASDSDEDLLEYWKQTISSSWHMTGTLKMGQEGDKDKDAVVDPNFKLFGVQGLRVADMSVVPVLMSAHIQATAYVTGMTCAEKLVAEYYLA